MAIRLTPARYMFMLCSWRCAGPLALKRQGMDTLSPAERSERMARVRSRDSRPERRVRSILHQSGYRFRLHGGDLVGRPDIVFRRRRAVIFVHGCFWHRHDDPTCRLARSPKSRQDFWQAKFAANQKRDAVVLQSLRQDGWRVLTLWECELGERNQQDLRRRLQDFLGPPCHQLNSSPAPGD